MTHTASKIVEGGAHKHDFCICANIPVKSKGLAGYIIVHGVFFVDVRKELFRIE